MSSGGVPLPASLPDSPDSHVSAPPLPNPGEVLALMLVRVGGRWFALDARMVQEVAVKGAVTRVPTAARHVLGVAGLRGGVVPVISLEQLVGTVGPAATELAPTRPRLVVVRAGDCEIALVVDEIRGIVDELPAAVTAEIRSGGRPPFLRAEFEWQGKLVCVLDVAQLVVAAAGRSQEGD